MAFNAGKPVDNEILTEAYEVTKHGDKKSWGEETLRQTACHECGHAILNYLAGNNLLTSPLKQEVILAKNRLTDDDIEELLGNHA